MTQEYMKNKRIEVYTLMINNNNNNNNNNNRNNYIK